MSKIQDLDLPPIQEAQISVTYEIQPQLEQVDLKDQDFSNDFTIRKDFIRFSQEIKIGSKGAEAPRKEVNQHIGYRYNTEDGKRVVISSIESLIYSKIGSYKDWDSFYPEFAKILQYAQNSGQTNQVSVIALRFINSIKLRQPFDIKELFNIWPELPRNKYNCSLNGFLVRYNLNEESGMESAVNLYFKGVDKDNSVEIIFDITVQNKKSYGFDLKKIEGDFAILRDFKNEIFFSAITDKLIEENFKK